MNNIFENAYFGKHYKTSEDTVALYLGKDIGDYKYRLAVSIMSDITNDLTYVILQCDEFGCSKSDIDIVSEWQEEINEEELDKLANEESLWLADVPLQERIFKDGLKVGFRKAKENK